MKKLIALLLAVAMVACLFVGCGEKPVEEDPTTEANNIKTGDIEKNSLDITIKNTRLEDKPRLNIQNIDSKEKEVKIEGTKYKVSVTDLEGYNTNNPQYKEEQYSLATDK